MLALDAAAGVVVGVFAVVAFFAVLWVALVFSMVRDARRRSESQVFALFTGALGLLPYLGILIYLVVRPPRTLDEERVLALEEQALALSEAQDTAMSDTRACPNCGREIENEFVICPYCRTQFARRCGSCQRWLRLGWQVCPYCAEEVGVRALGGGRAASS